jgi:hypothetical protein
VTVDTGYGLFLFDSTNLALRAERRIKAVKVSCVVIPAPVEFVSGCGIALLVEAEDLDRAKVALDGCEGHTVLYPYVRKQRCD